MEASPGRALERLELRIERLQVTFRFTFAFHAREVRFERDAGDGFERIFPETFSFHAQRHDPSELALQLDDLLRRPRLISPGANRRDARTLVERLLAQAPRYLEAVHTRLEDEGRLDPVAMARVHQDIALLSQMLLRFIETRELEDQRPIRVGSFLLRKLGQRALLQLMLARVEPEYLAAYIRGEVDPIDASDDPSESGFFHILESGEADGINRMLVRMSERAFYLWLEGVCLDEDNQAFEKEDSPFSSREDEVLAAINSSGRADVRIERGQDLTPFLRRPGRDCRRILQKLEAWFLRQYDIRHSSALIHHEAAIASGTDDARQTLSWHTPRIHTAVLLVLIGPFVAAAFFYQRAPMFFDALCSAEVVIINASAIWFLLYRFLWRRDLSFFHASVPRIVAGIVVGYLPVFLIDEVWDLAGRSTFVLSALSMLLGLVTLLYIYVEVQRRIGDTTVAFERARGLFLLGLVVAFGVGVVVTSLVGRYMVSRNWSPQGMDLPVGELAVSLEPIAGQLPRIVGLEPFYAFPSVLLMMTFLSFFIGIFLQLMWEELPVTEPL